MRTTHFHRDRRPGTRRGVSAWVLGALLAATACDEGTCYGECKDQYDECVRVAATEQEQARCDQLLQRCYGVCSARERLRDELTPSDPAP